jgi:predicted homoserine dehydrogenase-like protein
MYLHADLLARAAEGRPVRAALIGAGKFGSMFLSQVPTTPGLEVAVIADLRPDAARAACRGVGWDEGRIAATAFTDDAGAAIGRDDVDVVIEATGHPRAGVAHARAAFAAGKHIVMVNVEADALVGALLAKEAASAGVVYSMAYGDQPALTAEMVDWARSCGFEVVAAGKGTKYLPEYHASTPATVWGHYGMTANEAGAAGMNAKMFNSFLDGTKSALETPATSPFPRTASPSRPAAWTNWPRCCAPRPRAGRWSGRGRSRWCRRCIGTAARWNGICVGGSTWCSRRRTTTPPPVSGNTG